MFFCVRDCSGKPGARCHATCFCRKLFAGSGGGLAAESPTRRGTPKPFTYNILIYTVVARFSVFLLRRLLLATIISNRRQLGGLPFRPASGTCHVYLKIFSAGLRFVTGCQQIVLSSFGALQAAPLPPWRFLSWPAACC